MRCSIAGLVASMAYDEVNFKYPIVFRGFCGAAKSRIASAIGKLIHMK